MNLLNLPSLHPHKVGVSSAHLQHRWACLCAPATDGLSAPSGWACIDSRPQRGTGTPAPWTRTHSISDKPAREPSRRDRWATAKTHASNLNCGSGPPEQNLQFCSPSNVVGHVTLTTCLYQAENRTQKISGWMIVTDTLAHLKWVPWYHQRAVVFSPEGVEL